MLVPQTRQRLLDVATQVFNEDFSAPLEQIAERAGVTRRTLHRYFASREELLSSCLQEARRICSQLMAEAMDSSDEPRTQLERMLNAGINCGTKYALFTKLESQSDDQQTVPQEDCPTYHIVYARFRSLILKLQAESIISLHITPEWVMLFFNSIMVTTINAESTGSVARTNIRQFAWFSFSRGIGLLNGV
jgi:AcrR family transcriptional regulator